MLKFTKDLASKAKIPYEGPCPPLSLDDYIQKKNNKKKNNSIGDAFSWNSSWTTAAVESVVVSNPDGGLQQQLQDKVLFSTVYYFDLWLHTLKESCRMFYLC